MKNIFYLFIFILLGSCVSHRVWDTNVPEQNLTTVRFTNIKIDSYNGISVEKFYWVSIPAGNATFSGIANMYHGGLNFRVPAEFTYKFDAGKSYIVSGGAKDTYWGVFVYEAENVSSANTDNLLAFIQFKNQ